MACWTALKYEMMFLAKTRLMSLFETKGAPGYKLLRKEIKVFELPRGNRSKRLTAFVHQHINERFIFRVDI